MHVWRGGGEASGLLDEMKGESEAVAAAGLVEEACDVAFDGLEMQLQEQSDLDIAFALGEPVGDLGFAG
jgi:hypothetical protein